MSTRSQVTTNAYMLSYRRVDPDRNEKHKEICELSEETKKRIFGYLEKEHEQYVVFDIYFEKDEQMIMQTFHFNADRPVEYVRNYSFRYFMKKSNAYEMDQYK